MNLPVESLQVLHSWNKMCFGSAFPAPYHDSHVFTYASHAVDHLYDSPAELIGAAPIEMKNVCETACEHNETKTECEHINETKTECEYIQYINETKYEHEMTVCELAAKETVSEHIHIEMKAECELNATTECELNETSVYAPWNNSV